MPRYKGTSLEFPCLLSTALASPGLTDVVVGEAHGHEVLGRPKVVHLMAPKMKRKAGQLKRHPAHFSHFKLLKQELKILYIFGSVG